MTKKKILWPYILDGARPIPFLFKKIAPFVTQEYQVSTLLNDPDEFVLDNINSNKSYEPNSWRRKCQYLRMSLSHHHLVHTGGSENIHYTLMRFIGQKPRSPRHIHTLRVDVDPDSEFNTKKREWLSKEADLVTAVSKHTAKTAERYFSVEPEVVYNGIDPNTFHPGYENTLDYPWLESDHLVIFVGKLVDRKRPEDVIKVAKRLSEVQFVIIGDGPKYDLLSQKSDETNNLTMAGRLSKDELPYIYANASMLLFPTLREGCPNVVLEALASGIPVVGYDATSMPEIITDGETGFLIEPKNVNKLTEKVKLLLDEKNRKEFVKRARSYAVNNHSFDEISGDYLDTYSRLIDP